MLLQPTNEPDILEVIADLSNDEVFTPPKVANAVLDLLPNEVWTNPELRWLDPGAKTGVFLREVTRRLMVGLEPSFPDEQVRLEHILTNMVFGIAVTNLTAMMSRRTLYCSKDATSGHAAVTMETSGGHIWFERVEHPYDKNGRCPECSASKAQMEKAGKDNHAYGFIHAAGREAIEEEFDMKFDVIVGNPPYQMEADAAGKNVISLYEHFVHQAKALDPRYIAMIIPSRWMAGGRGLDEFRSEMLSDTRVRAIVDYENAKQLFPSVGINGGVCYFFWDRDMPGPCFSTFHRSDVTIGPDKRDLGEFDVYVRDGRALPLLRKVRAVEEDALAEIISARDPFGPALSSNIKDFRTSRKEGEIRLRMPQGGASEERWIARSLVTRNEHLIDSWKVLIPKAGSGRERETSGVDMVIFRPLVAGPESACTASYIVAGPLASEAHADSLVSYLSTRFARFLISLRKASQNTTRETYAWVPQQSWDRIWTDDELYAKYGITGDEQAYIAEMIREMPS